LLRKVKWGKANNDNGWSFVGNANEFPTFLAQKNIDKYFQDILLQIAINQKKFLKKAQHVKLKQLWIITLLLFATKR